MDRKTFRALCLAHTYNHFTIGKHFVVVSNKGKPTNTGRLGNIAYVMTSIQYELDLPAWQRNKDYIREMIAHMKRIRTK